jgi:hypothetical protein
MKQLATSPQPPAARHAEPDQRIAMPAQSSHKLYLLLASLIVAIGLGSGSRLLAQTSSAALSGIVTDTTGAHIPGAKASLVNQESKDTRNTTANSNGVYNFSGLTPGTYTLTVTYKGFETFKENSIELHPGDSTTLVPIALKIGEQNITVEVSAHDEMASNGEVSSLITAEDIKHLATEGRDVTELVKILPGFALQPGGSSNYGLSNVAPDSETVGPGGSLGNYSAAGSPSNGVGLISDGANVQDPGTGGATTQTINMDMVEEVKVSTSNFGADTAKGPVVINAVGKAGGQSYHGTMYVIGRTTQLNSTDWLIKNQGYSKPHDRYIYPGFTIGGPIRVPGTNFNSSKKLLFLIGAEDYIQRNVYLGGSGSSALHLSTVPTDCMRGMTTDSYTNTPCANPGMADFSRASLNNLFHDSNLATDCVAGGTLSVFTNYCAPVGGVDDPQGYQVTGGLFPATDIDPGSAVYLNKLFPHQNRTAQAVLGTSQPSDGFDRSDVYLTNYDYRQARARIDFNANQNNKFYAVYNNEGGQSYNPFTLYGNLNYSSGTLRDPSIIISGVNSQTASANYVHIFGPTLTSETFAAASFYLNTFNPKNESLQTKTTLNYPYLNLANNGSQQIPQTGYSSGVPLYQGPDFTFGQSFSRKISIDFGDNVTKVYKTHTIKIGFYFERVANNQLSAGSPTQGSFAEYGTYSGFYHPNDKGGANSSNPGNTIAQFFWGDANYYSQSTLTPLVDLYYTAVDGFVTDSWKVLRHLTLDLGVRFDHLGPWSDPHNIGPAYWFPQNYVTPANGYPTTVSGTATGVPRSQLPGIAWHGENSSVSNSVGQGRWAFVSPRVGFAWDAFGNGRTVVTGGAGLYRSHDTWNDYVGAMGTALGQFSQYVDNTTLSCVDAVSRGTAAGIPACNYGINSGTYTGPATAGQNVLASTSDSINVVDPNDNQQPLTTTYALGVNQSIKHVGNILINFVGNKSNHLLLTSAFGANVNTIPMGGLFGPDPNPKSPGYGVITQYPDNIGALGTLVDDYRPFPFYNDVQLIRHALHSNYNSLQTSWTRYTGKFHYNVNYTWSKALGYRGVDGNGNVPDATNFRNDYGIAAIDRTNVVNASYTYIEGKAFHLDRIADGFLNNWEISGITNLASGPNIQAAYGNNFQLYGTEVGNNPANFTDNKTYLGTPDILLQPVTTCDPSTNLAKNQFINSKCLTIGPQGVNGPFTYPYLRGPAFFNSDLSLQKGIRFSGRKELQFRYSAFNFMNHPLTSLVAATATPLRLVIAGPGGAANSAFGISDYKQGRRVSEITVRFNY